MNSLIVIITSSQEGVHKRYRVSLDPDFEHTSSSRIYLDNYFAAVAKGMVQESKPSSVLGVEEIIEP